MPSNHKPHQRGKKKKKKEGIEPRQNKNKDAGRQSSKQWGNAQITTAIGHTCTETEREREYLQKQRLCHGCLDNEMAVDCGRAILMVRDVFVLFHNGCDTRAR